MVYVFSTLLCVLHFPHKGQIITVDRLSFFSPDSLTGNVLYVGNTTILYDSVGAGLFKDCSLMGIFSLLPPNVALVNMISSGDDP